MAHATTFGFAGARAAKSGGTMLLIALMTSSASCCSPVVGRLAEAVGPPARSLALGVSAGGWRLHRAAIGPAPVP